MATSKKKSETFLDRDKHTLEFTPAQLMGAIITLLIFGTGCFLLGIVVNKVDNARGGRGAEVAVVEADTTPEREGTQTTPRVDAVETSVTADTERAKLPRTVTVPPKKKELREVPLPDPKAAVPAESDQASVAKAEPPIITPPVSATSKETAPPASDTPTPAPVEQEPPVQIAEAEAPLEMPITEAATVAAAALDTPAAQADGKYAIQVISFSTANRQQADEFMQLMSKQTELSPRLVESKDGKHLRVVVGSFADKAAAEQKRKELAQIKQFQDCFVQAIP